MPTHCFAAPPQQAELRDAQQASAQTRGRTADMERALGELAADAQALVPQSQSSATTLAGATSSIATIRRTLFALQQVCQRFLCDTN